MLLNSRKRETTGKSACLEEEQPCARMRARVISFFAPKISVYLHACVFTRMRILLKMDGRSQSVSRERLEQLLPAAYDSYQLLVSALDLMVQNRIETLHQLNQIADALDKRHGLGNIAKVAGATTGILGSAAAAIGVALTPLTLGFGLVLTVGGAAVATLGSFATVGAHVTEKVCEKIDLETVQRAIDADKRQCEAIKELWKEFENYCDELINTIALADPSRESDMASIQTWTQVALEEITHSVIFIAEAFESIFSCSKGNVLVQQMGKDLCDVLGETACRLITNPRETLHSVVSRLKVSLTKMAGTIAFMAIAGVFLGSVIVLVMTLIDLHKGSQSEVAKDLREKSTQLNRELNCWLDAFGKPVSN